MEAQILLKTAQTAWSNNNITAKTAEHGACLSRNERQKNAKTDHPQCLPRAHQFARSRTGFWCCSPKCFQMDCRACKKSAQSQRYLISGETRGYSGIWRSLEFCAQEDQYTRLWTVLCRRTRQIIAFVIGDRSENTCRRLWKKVPIEYRHCLSYSDFWDAYQKVLPQEAHHAIGKESGQTSHMERWYCTLRQHQARYVRKTLSFSKRDAFHHMVTKWFIVDHNLARKQPASLTL